MYLPSMTTEELVRYASTAATTDLERELVKHAMALLEDCDDNDKMQDQVFHLSSAGVDFANAVRDIAAMQDDVGVVMTNKLLDIIEKFEKETEDALK